MKRLSTGLQELESAAELEKLIAESENVMVLFFRYIYFFIIVNINIPLSIMP